MRTESGVRSCWGGAAVWCMGGRVACHRASNFGCLSQLHVAYACEHERGCMALGPTCQQLIFGMLVLL